MAGEGAFRIPVSIEVHDNLQEFAAHVQSVIGQIRGGGGKFEDPFTGMKASATEAAKFVGAMFDQMDQHAAKTKASLKAVSSGAGANPQSKRQYEEELRILEKQKRTLTDLTRSARTTESGEVVAPRAAHRQTEADAAKAQRRADSADHAAALREGEVRRQARERDLAAAKTQEQAARQVGSARLGQLEKIRQAEERVRREAESGAKATAKAAGGSGAGGQPPKPPTAAAAPPPEGRPIRSTAARTQAAWEAEQAKPGAHQVNPAHIAESATEISDMAEAARKNSVRLSLMADNLHNIIGAQTREKVERQRVTTALETEAAKSDLLARSKADELAARARSRSKLAEQFDVNTDGGLARTQDLARAKVLEDRNQRSQRNIEIAATDPQEVAIAKHLEAQLQRRVAVEQRRMELASSAASLMADEKVLLARLNRETARLVRARETPQDRQDIASGQLADAARKREIDSLVREGTDVKGVARDQVGQGSIDRQVSIERLRYEMLSGAATEMAREKVLRAQMNRAVESEVRLQQDMIGIAQSNAEKARAISAQRRLDRAAETPADRFNTAQDRLEEAARKREIEGHVRRGTDVGAIAAENADIARLRVSQKRADIAATTPGDRSAAAELTVESRLAVAQQKLADLAQLRTLAGQRTLQTEQQLASEGAVLKAEQAKLAATDQRLIQATADEANAREEQAARLVFARAGVATDLTGPELLARAAVLKRTVADNQRAAVAAATTREDIEAGAAKRLAEAKLRAAINAREREMIREGIKNNSISGGNWFQALQSRLSPNSNRLPEENLKFGQFLGDKVQRTVGYAASGALLGGGISAISSMVKDASALEVGFVRLRGQLDGIGQAQVFPEMRDQIRDIAAETGQASADVQQFLSRMIGLDNDPAAALRDTESAMKLATVTGLDMKTMMTSIVPIQKAFGVTAEEIGDEIVGMGEKFGIAEDDFTQFLGKTASVAKGAGLNFKEISIIGANLANSLGKPIDAASEAINKSFQQVDQNKEKILNILAQNPATSADVEPIIADLGKGETGQAVIGLLKAARKFDATQKDAILKNVVSRREAEEFNALIQNAGPILEQLGESAGNAEQNSGKLDKRFRDLKETVQVTFQTFKAAVEALGDALFRSGLSDILVDIGSGLKTVASAAGFVFDIFGKINEATTVFGVGIVGTMVKMAAMGAILAKAYSLLIGLKNRSTEASGSEDLAEQRNIQTKARLEAEAARAAAAEGELAGAKGSSAAASGVTGGGAAAAGGGGGGASGAFGGAPFFVTGGTKSAAAAATGGAGEKLAFQAEGDAAAEVQRSLVLRQLVAQRRNASAVTQAAEDAKLAAVRQTAKEETDRALVSRFVARERIKEATAEHSATVRSGIASEAVVPASFVALRARREAEIVAAQPLRSFRMERSAPVPLREVNRDLLVQRFGRITTERSASAAAAEAAAVSAAAAATTQGGAAAAASAAADPGVRAARLAAVRGAVGTAWSSAGDAIKNVRGVSTYDARKAAAAEDFRAQQAAGTLGQAGLFQRSIAGGKVIKTPVADARLDATGQTAFGASPVAVAALVAAGAIAVKSAWDEQSTQVNQAAEDLKGRIRRADQANLDAIKANRTDFWERFTSEAMGAPLAEDLAKAEQGFRDTTEIRKFIGAEYYKPVEEDKSILGATKAAQETGYESLYRKYAESFTKEQFEGVGTKIASTDEGIAFLSGLGIETTMTGVQDAYANPYGRGTYAAETTAQRTAKLTKDNLPKFLQGLRTYKMGEKGKEGTDAAVTSALRQLQDYERTGATPDMKALANTLSATGNAVGALEASGGDPASYIANLTQLSSGGPSFKSLEELKKELAAGRITQNEFVTKSAGTMSILEQEAKLFQGEAGDRARMAFIDQQEFMSDLYEKQMLTMAEFANKVGQVASATPKTDQLTRHTDALRGARFTTQVAELPKVFDEVLAAREEQAGRIADPYARAEFLNKPIELPPEARATFVRDQINKNQGADTEARRLAELAGLTPDDFKILLAESIVAGKTPEAALLEYLDQQAAKWDEMAARYEEAGMVVDAALAKANADEFRRRKGEVGVTPGLDSINTGSTEIDPNTQALNDLNAATEARQARTKVLAAIYSRNPLAAAKIASDEADAAYLDMLKKRELGKATDKDVADAQAASIEADVREQEANRSYARLRGNRRVLLANGDPLAEIAARRVAAEEERAYLQSLGGAADPNAVEQNEQDFIGIDQQQAQAQLDLIRSGMSVTEALVERSPIEAAQAALRRAEFEEQNAIGAIAKQEALANRIKAQHSLEDTLERGLETRAALASAVAGANDDPVGVARIAADEARRKLEHARSQGIKGDDLAPFLAEVTTADRELVRTSVQDQIDSIDFMQSMGQISMGQAIESLRAVLSTVKVGSKEYEQLSLKIKQMSDSASADLQFNLPSTLGLPTLYEARRMSQSAQMGVGYQDNRNVTVQIAVNGAQDPMAVTSQVMAAFQSAAGGGSMFSPGIGVGV